MKLPLIICLVLALINGSVAFWLINFLVSIADSFIISFKRLTTDTTNTACHVFSNAIKRHPINPPFIENVYFQLRTASKRIKVGVNEAERLREIPEFVVSRKTVVFVGGWMTTVDEDCIDDLARAYHCRGGYNFVAFDVGSFLINDYLNAAYNSEQLGEFLAIGLQKLNCPIESIHVIGSSLGAHIVGSAGRYFHKITGQKLVRITGLDPAMPCFATPAVFPRLWRGDADFVDTIRTNPSEYGMDEVVGDADFFAGGLDVIKPGCSKLSLACSHRMSLIYYIETVYPGNENNFIGALCGNYSDMANKNCTGPKSAMGFATEHSSRGVYYLDVRGDSPYGVDAKCEHVVESAESICCCN